MLPPRTLLMAALAYLMLLFVIALFAEKRARAGHSLIDNGWAYGLSLAVYCTAWTYFGSVGRATTDSLGFLPIYVGPTLAMTLAAVVLRKLLLVTKQQRLTSIADLIAARYGKRHSLGSLVSLIALAGALPYIALQLKAVSLAFDLLSGTVSAEPPPWFADSGLYLALLLAAFTVVFGTRHMDATERHEGLVAAIAFESIVKLVAFLAVGAFVCFALYDGPQQLYERAAAAPDLRALLMSEGSLPTGWFSLVLLSTLAAIMLPRQFQITFVENIHISHLRRASWLFPAYLLLINLFVIPIALAGVLQFGHSGNADTLVLRLPLANQQPGLALLVFIGGLSAATGMVVVETIAIATMLSNEVVVPLLIRLGLFGRTAERTLGVMLISIRRSLIILIVLLGYGYFRAAGNTAPLVSIGLVSFAAVAQFAPALIGGLYWRGGRHGGAFAGLLAGFAIWLYTLVLPALVHAGWLASGLLTEGPWQLAFLRPEHLFHSDLGDPISHTLFWSMLCNAGLYVLMSLRRAPDAREAAQAAIFVDVTDSDAPNPSFWRGGATVAALTELLARFLGRSATERLLRSQRATLIPDSPADPALLQFAEHQLAGAIGSASARAMVASIVTAAPLAMEDVLSILDEASEARAQSRRLEAEQATLAAVSRELRASNERLQELDRLKDDFMSSVTHELRTPLTSIRAFSELLRDTPDIAHADQQRFLGIIISESERLTRLVNQVLDLAKIEAGSADWQASPVQLDDVIEAACAATSQLFRDKGIDLSIAAADMPVRVEADRDRLVQVLINLLSNAVKASPSQAGRVSIRVRPGAREVAIDISDNGPGVAEQERDTIFERFRQGGDARSRAQGTGLGLHISRRIIEHFGGRLEVHNQAQGGACFRCTLPVRHDDAGSATINQEQTTMLRREDHAQEDPDRG